MNLLIPNLGSTSLKYQILDMPSETAIAKGRLERVTNYRDAIAQISTGGTAIDAIALKAVHAGPDVSRHVRGGRRRRRRATPVPSSRARAQRDLSHRHRGLPEAMPGVPIVAAFEPEFHRTMPEHARLYGVPGPWLE